MTDPYNLERFVAAQDQGGTYQAALAELRRGRKTSHWMWFVFPQLAGFGHSAMAQRYAISSLDEARAYLAHPVLGARLVECATVVASTRDRSALEIFGGIDALKLHSSMTLFAQAAADPEPFRAVVDRFFGGLADEQTMRRLNPA